MPDTIKHFVRVDGQLVPVTEEIYLAYYRSKRRDRYYERDIKTESALRDTDGSITGYIPAKEDSLDRLMEAGEDYASDIVPVEDTALLAVMGRTLRDATSLLTEDERGLIDALFFSNGGSGMTEREYAELCGVPHQTVHSRKVRILAALKKLLGN